MSYRHPIHQVLERLRLGLVLGHTDSLHELGIQVVRDQRLGKAAEILLEDGSDRTNILINVGVHEIRLHADVICLHQLPCLSRHSRSPVNPFNLQTAFVYSFNALFHH